jgi:hypothetical protein
MLSIVMLASFMLSVAFLIVVLSGRGNKAHNSDFRYAECPYADCRNGCRAKYHNAGCRN